MFTTAKNQCALWIAVAIAMLIHSSNAGYELSATRIIRKMEAVADWELTHPASARIPEWHGGSDPLGWSQGTFYTGLAALADRSGNAAYGRAIFALGDKQAWGLGPDIFNANDSEFAQNWIWVYNHNHNPAMIAPTRKRFDAIIAANPSGSLLMTPADSPQQCFQRWCWSDALFMAPPGWVALSQVTHDPKYLAYADMEYRATTALLFDPKEALFYRDSSFIGKTGAHGEKIFWSRGNGWVYAGLVRILKELPPGSSSRSLYESLYLQMSRKLVTVQKADGSWASSLLDPRSDTPLELSGTSFFTYGLASGIKTGLLKDPIYRQAANRGWFALLKAVRPDGKLGWVQEPGSGPDEVSAQDTQPYGAGAFLLAGSAMSDLAIER